ncbi:hypothetical protein ACHAXM_011034 [Skeletonema potamos]
MHKHKQHFLTTIKREQYERVRYHHEYSKFVRSSNSVLDQLEECYSQSLITKDQHRQESIWLNVCKLNDILFCKDWSVFRRNKVLKELYDCLSRLEINKWTSRPNFDVCVKLCCGENGCQPGSSTERSVHLASEAVFNSFDTTLRQGMIQWRLFIFYLHFLLEPTLSCEEQLKKAFIIISSSDGLDADIAMKPSIDLHDLASILFPLVKSSAMEMVLSVFDEAWALVNVSGRSKQVNNTKLSLNTFEKMLNQRVIQRFFARSNTSWGDGVLFPIFLCRWEEEFYNVTLLNLIKNARRDEAIRDKLVRDDNWKRRHVYQYWRRFITHQKSLRHTFNAMNHMVTMNMKARGHCALAWWKTKQHSMCDIQRVGRGFMGRIKARIRSMMNKSATLIQTHSRIYLARKKLQQLISAYVSAVIKVQSLFRSVLARRLALKKLMTLVEKERMDNANEMKRYAFERGIWCVTILQSHQRRNHAVIVVNQLRQQRRRENEVRHAMEARNAAFRRERKLYQRQLEEFYRQMKEDHDTSKKSATKLLQDKIRLRTLQRRIKNEELKSQEPDRIMEEKLATEQWKRDWLAKIEVDVARTKEHYVQCMDRAANRTDKKTRSIARKRIKKRVSEVLARADAKNILMETKEAKVIAREEVLYMIGEEERERLLRQMNNAFTKREQDKEAMRIQTETAAREAHARATVYAVSVVAAACRRWRARKEIRRLCLERYEKKYDGDHHTFYYKNKQTGEVSWTKPKAMGVFDVPVKDEWVVLRDLHNFPYYFNPSNFEMRWIPPPNVEVCGEVSGCPNFACYLNEEDGIRYCQECFDRFEKTVKLNDEFSDYYFLSRGQSARTGNKSASESLERRDSPFQRPNNDIIASRNYNQNNTQ